MTDNTLWRYSQPSWRALYDSGIHKVNQEEMASDFVRWCRKNIYAFIREESTGNIFHTLCAKRGNSVYAERKNKQYTIVGELIASKTYDYPSLRRGFRLTLPAHGKPAYGHQRRTRILFTTLTYDTKLYTQEQAWKRVSDDINSWKANMRNIFGKHGYVSLCVKEGTERGYPAPHLLVILKKPVLVTFWAGQKGDKWIVASHKLYAQLHDAWYRVSDGSKNMDVQGVIGGKMGDSSTLTYYLTKYIGKSLQPSNKTALYTLAWQKFYGIRDIIPKDFMEEVTGVSEDPSNRLDDLYNELKSINRKLAIIEQEKGGFRYQTSEERALIRRKKEIMEEMPPPDPPKYTYVDGYSSTKSGGIPHVLNMAIGYSMIGIDPSEVLLSKMDPEDLEIIVKGFFDKIRKS